MSSQYTFTTTEEKCVARFSSHDGAHSPCYTKPKEVTLRVVRRDQPLKVGRKTYPAGYITNVSVVDFNWAEYSGDMWDEDSSEFMAEEWRMSIISGWKP
jgi:hypothetical protein